MTRPVSDIRRIPFSIRMEEECVSALMIHKGESRRPVGEIIEAWVREHLPNELRRARAIRKAANGDG